MYTKILTQQDFKRLLLLYKKGSQNALALIVNSYGPLIKSVIHKYYKNKDQREREDLFSEGLIGLLEAIKKYDLTKDVQFSTYAYFFIKFHVITYLETNLNFVHIPHDIFLNLNRLYKDNIKLDNIDSFNKNKFSEKYNIQKKKAKEILITQSIVCSKKEQEVDQETLPVKTDYNFIRIANEIFIKINIWRQTLNNSQLQLLDKLFSKQITLEQLSKLNNLCKEKNRKDAQELLEKLRLYLIKELLLK